MEIHNKYTLTQHIRLDQGVPDNYMSIILHMGDFLLLRIIGLGQNEGRGGHDGD